MELIRIVVTIVLAGALGMYLRESHILVSISLVLLAIVYGLLSIVRIPAEKGGRVTSAWPFSEPPAEGRFIVPTGGQGIWAKLLHPGWHHIPFIRLYANVDLIDPVHIPKDQYGLIRAKDGEPPPEGQIVSPLELTYDDYTKGDSFIEKKGQKGFQLLTLAPGTTHFLNPSHFEVVFNYEDPNNSEINTKLTTIDVKHVGVLVSSVGEDSKEEDREYLHGVQGDEHGNPAYILKPGRKNMRGILPESLPAGEHPVNKLAYKIVLVDITSTRVVLDGKTEVWIGGHKAKFDSAKGVSKNGHTIPVHVELVIRVPTDKAPHMVAFGGSFKEFIEDTVVPYLDDLVQTAISERETIEMIEERRSFRTLLESGMRAALEGPEYARQAMPETEGDVKAAEEGIELGSQRDKRQFYPIKVDSLRLMELDFGQFTGPLAEFVRIVNRRANATQEKEAVVIETEVAQSQIALEQQQAEAVRQASQQAGQGLVDIIKQLNPQGGTHWVTQVFTLGLAHPDVRELIDAASELLKEQAQQLHAGHGSHHQPRKTAKKEENPAPAGA